MTFSEKWNLQPIFPMTSTFKRVDLDNVRESIIDFMLITKNIKVTQIET